MPGWNAVGFEGRLARIWDQTHNFWQNDNTIIEFDEKRCLINAFWKPRYDVFRETTSQETILRNTATQQLFIENIQGLHGME